MSSKALVTSCFFVLVCENLSKAAWSSSLMVWSLTRMALAAEGTKLRMNRCTRCEKGSLRAWKTCQFVYLLGKTKEKREVEHTHSTVAEIFKIALKNSGSSAAGKMAATSGLLSRGT